MKTLYLDLIGGISGDMFLGALIDLGISPDNLISKLKSLPLKGWSLSAKQIEKNGIIGTHVDIHIPSEHLLTHEQEHHSHNAHENDHNHHQPHEHHGFTEIKQIIENSDLSAWVKEHSINLFRRIGEEEAKIHGKTLETIHFHEVGAIDSIIDLVGASIGLELLGKPQVQAKYPVDGNGFTHCAHGIIPIPVPATLAILGTRSVPITQCEEESEMITPTGAAILAEFVTSFGPMKNLTSKKIGISFGARTLKTRPNMLRAILGESLEMSPIMQSPSYQTDQVELLQTNLDDTTPEILGYVMEQALSKGALDIWYTPIQMKKSRPAVELSLLCKIQDSNKMINLILTETSSIGVRHFSVERCKLHHKLLGINTKYGFIPIKVSYKDGKILHIKPEYEICRILALKHNLPIQDIINEGIKNSNFSKESLNQ